MRFLTILFLFMIGCRSGSPISLVYKRYEPVRGGRILVTNGPMYDEQMSRYEELEERIIGSVCGNQPHRIIDEGIVSAPGAIVSERLPYGRIESSIRYTTAQYKNFVCGSVAAVPPNARIFGPNSDEP